MDFGKLNGKFRELSANQLISVAVVFLVIIGGGFIYLSVLEKEELQYPSKMEIASRPGAAVLVPFNRKLTGDETNFANAVYGDMHTDPNELPGGISILRSGVYFRSSGAVGDVLIWTPPETSGGMRFSLSASADADGAGPGGQQLQSESIKVGFRMVGEPVLADEPNFAGSWSDDEEQWRFAPDGAKQLTIIKNGESSAIDYNLYPDQDGRWFLLEIDAVQPRLYWLETEGDRLTISLPGPDFQAMAELHRGTG